MKFKLQNRREIAENTFEIEFETQKDFKFKPGQWIQIIIQDPQDKTKTIKRAFSIASSPNKKNIVHICFRINEYSSILKKSLLEDKIGSLVEIEGPNGKFVLPKTDKEIFMIAGGIGLTPFISMINYLIEKKTKNKINLAITDKSEKRTPYLKELREMSKQHENFALTYQTKRIDKKFLEEIKNPKEKLFAICGSTEMVNEIKQNLLDLKISEENILTEKFGGD